jgi:hypothetical protein
MGLKVVGAGVGRTGTHSLKLALERLLDAPCHHMIEILADPAQMPVWTDAIDGKEVDWHRLLARYGATVDWPGASFWRELLAANPDALVLLSVRDPEVWYRSASNTIFVTADFTPPAFAPWMETVRRMFRTRFSDRFDDEATMIEAYERHNAAVRAEAPAGQLLEWTPSDGWDPICERLGVAVPDEPFPVTNTTDEFRSMFGMPPAS